MRTTLSLDDVMLELAARHAKLRGVSLGKAVSDLLRKGLNAPTPTEEKDGLVVFRLPADLPQCYHGRGVSHRGRRRMKGYLLDTNLLVALLWPSHENHAVARQWFTRHRT